RVQKSVTCPGGGGGRRAAQQSPSCAGITVMDNRWSAERGWVLYRGRRRESRARGRCQARAWHLELRVVPCGQVSHSDGYNSQFESYTHTLVAGAVPGASCHDKPVCVPAALQCMVLGVCLSVSPMFL